MAELTVQNITEAGLEASYEVADAAGDTFQNDSSGRVFLHIKNGSASAMTVSVALDQTTKTVPGFGQMTKSAASVEVDANSDEFVGPFPISAYGAEPEISYTDETDVTIAALKV